MSERVLSFRFFGGEADRNELNFYDASRFMYGAARFVYTLEHYRQTGRVLGRITEKINVDFRVSTPRPGSWIQDVILASTPIIADAALKVPIDVFVAWVFDKLVPARRSRESAARIAEAYARQEEARTEQSRQETERMRILADSNERHLQLVEHLLRREERLPALDDQLTETRDELRASVLRDESLSSYRSELTNISASDEKKILDRAQPQLVEIGKPLLRSAGKVAVHGNVVRGAFGVLNRRSLEFLGGLEVDMEPSSLLGSITRYDKETGWGKFRNPQFSRPISFHIPPGRKGDLGYVIIDEMKNEETLISFYYVRDKRGVAKHLIVNRILEKPLE